MHPRPRPGYVSWATLALSALFLLHCEDDPESAHDSGARDNGERGSATLDTDFPDVAGGDETDSAEEDPGPTDADADPDLDEAACPPIGTPGCDCFPNGSQGMLCDAAPPCETLYDEQGCPYLSCTGSCLPLDLGDDDMGLDTPPDSEPDSPSGLLPWDAFEIVRTAGPCMPGNVCRWNWLVSPDGSVAGEKAGEPFAAELSDEDWDEVSETVGSEAFQSLMVGGFSCGLPPTDIFVSFRLAVGDDEWTQSVTGCVLGSYESGLAQPLYVTVTAY